ncbi:uncharacterized protein LAESUDRAFT_763082 [Laetiporus sulphureus 93-53]|uniref:Uncharacterized protein n=1 Tax=Laetiporus sulphureus 93-53 TaxID=1314785 RepID=A0A165C3H4_9APHY|nr:uncharacterized protein LAESUDRAFT_763082 [Laetiporus sulphureus 93-53]KZT02140.1 hypothetical protein LAESUDRAFT_763082 [Laetiporus sulphureus 93-53]
MIDWASMDGGVRVGLEQTVSIGILRDIWVHCDRDSSKTDAGHFPPQIKAHPLRGPGHHRRHPTWCAVRATASIKNKPGGTHDINICTSAQISRSIFSASNSGVNGSCGGFPATDWANLGRKQTKLQEAALTIETRTQAIDSLEERIRSSSATIELQKSALLEAEEAKATAEAAKVRAEEELSGTQQRLASTRAELNETLNGFAAVQRELENATALTESKVAEVDAERRSRAAIEKELYDTHKQKRELETAHLQMPGWSESYSANQDLQDTLAQTAAELDTKTSKLEAERIAHNKLEETLSTVQEERRETAATLTCITGELQAHLVGLKEGRRARAAIEDQLRACTSDLENTILQLRRNNDQHCQRITELEAQLQQST